MVYGKKPKKRRLTYGKVMILITIAIIVIALYPYLTKAYYLTTHEPGFDVTTTYIEKENVSKNTCDVNIGSKIDIKYKYPIDKLYLEIRARGIESGKEEIIASNPFTLKGPLKEKEFNSSLKGVPRACDSITEVKVKVTSYEKNVF